MIHTIPQGNNQSSGLDQPFSQDGFKLLFDTCPRPFLLLKCVKTSTGDSDFHLRYANRAAWTRFRLTEASGQSILELMPENNWRDVCIHAAFGPMNYTNKAENGTTEEWAVYSPCPGFVAALCQKETVDNSPASTGDMYIQAALFNEMPLGMCVFSPDGVILNRNRMFCEILGYQPEEMADMSFSDLFPREELLEYQIRLARLGGSAGCFQMESRMLCKDGKQVWVDMFSTVLCGRGMGYSMLTIQNINARKLNEIDLKTSQDRLEKAQLIANVGNWEISDGGNTFWASESALRIYGLTQVPQTFEEFQKAVCLEDRKKIYTAQRLLLEEGKAYDLEYGIVRRSDGAKRVIHAVTVPEYEGKDVPKAIGAIQDITERKRVETIARLNERKFRAIFEHALIGICTIDIDGRFINPNRRFCDLLGYTPEELSRLSYNQVIHPDDLNRSLIERSNVLSGVKDSIIMQKRLLRNGGDCIWVALTSILIKGSNSKYFLNTIHDITEQKTAEFALLASEKRYSAIFNQSPVAIEVFNAKGEFLSCNEASLELFGMENAEENKKFNLFSDQYIKGELLEQLLNQQVIHYEGLYDFDIHRFYHQTYNTSRSGFIHTDEVVIPMIIDGMVTGYMKQMQDVTKRKEIEEELRLSEQRYAAIYYQSPIAIEFYEADGTYASCNEASLRMFGITDDEINKKFRLKQERINEIYEQHNSNHTAVLSYHVVVDFDVAREQGIFDSYHMGKKYINIIIVPITVDNKIIGFIKQLFETENKPEDI